MGVLGRLPRRSAQGEGIPPEEPVLSSAKGLTENGRKVLLHLTARALYIRTDLGDGRSELREVRLVDIQSVAGGPDLSLSFDVTSREDLVIRYRGGSLEKLHGLLRHRLRRMPKYLRYVDVDGVRCAVSFHPWRYAGVAGFAADLPPGTEQAVRDRILAAAAADVEAVVAGEPVGPDVRVSHLPEVPAFAELRASWAHLFEGVEPRDVLLANSPEEKDDPARPTFLALADHGRVWIVEIPAFDLHPNVRLVDSERLGLRAIDLPDGERDLVVEELDMGARYFAPYDEAAAAWVARREAGRVPDDG